MGPALSHLPCAGLSHASVVFSDAEEGPRSCRQWMPIPETADLSSHCTASWWPEMSWKRVSLMSAKCHNIESLCTVRMMDSRWKTQSPFCQGKLRLRLTVGLHAGTHSPNPLLLESSPSLPALSWGHQRVTLLCSGRGGPPSPGLELPAGLCGPFCASGSVTA